MPTTDKGHRREELRANVWRPCYKSRMQIPARSGSGSSSSRYCAPMTHALGLTCRPCARTTSRTSGRDTKLRSGCTGVCCCVLAKSYTITCLIAEINVETHASDSLASFTSVVKMMTSYKCLWACIVLLLPTHRNQLHCLPHPAFQTMSCTCDPNP